ncbi:hypothetical protein [Trichothermofontia sp.]
MTIQETRQETVQEIERQALALPLSERWRLVHSLLGSIQQEMTGMAKPAEPGTLMNLKGVIKDISHLSDAELKEEYIDYLMEKYQ